ncbi:hypothetical protein ACODNH_05055 [Haloarcula sp. NS06]|uniref:hypothetical protein n=1 Tax=unclassified Haloarcula TaxID=2624677 RepID=UPI0027B6F932|nr:hypothetical protein [Haloarcula sp. H-GB4]MDQ2072868.1 hypothetical protein [Haloarcula sp. H-GB4]
MMGGFRSASEQAVYCTTEATRSVEDRVTAARRLLVGLETGQCPHIVMAYQSLHRVREVDDVCVTLEAAEIALGQLEKAPSPVNETAARRVRNAEQVLSGLVGGVHDE